MQSSRLFYLFIPEWLRNELCCCTAFWCEVTNWNPTPSHLLSVDSFCSLGCYWQWKFFSLRLSGERERSTQCVVNVEKRQLSSAIWKELALSVVAIKDHRHRGELLALTLICQWRNRWRSASCCFCPCPCFILFCVRLAEYFALYMETLRDAVACIRMPAHAQTRPTLLQPISTLKLRQLSEAQTPRRVSLLLFIRHFFSFSLFCFVYKSFIHLCSTAAGSF